MAAHARAHLICQRCQKTYVVQIGLIAITSDLAEHARCRFCLAPADSKVLDYLRQMIRAVLARRNGSGSNLRGVPSDN